MVGPSAPRTSRGARDPPRRRGSRSLPLRGLRGCPAAGPPPSRCTAAGTYTHRAVEPCGCASEIEYRVRTADRRRQPRPSSGSTRPLGAFLPDGSTEWRATFDDYQEVRDESTGRRVSIPEIRFEHPAERTRLKMRDVDLGIDIPATDAFTRAVPPDSPPRIRPL